VIRFGKIFNNKGFLNNFQFTRKPFNQNTLSQVFHLVKVLLRHASIEKCRRQLTRASQLKGQKDIPNLHTEHQWSFSGQAFHTCYGDRAGAPG
jgi:hypothetical protein